MKKTILVLGMLLLLFGIARGENEPGDNEPSGASVLVNNGAPGTGNMVEGDEDHYQVVNSAGYTNRTFHYAFEGSGNDFHSVRIYDEIGNHLISTSTSIVPAYAYTATISLPKNDITVANDDIFVVLIECLPDAAGGERAYTLTVTGTGSPHDLGQRSPHPKTAPAGCQGQSGPAQGEDPRGEKEVEAQTAGIEPQIGRAAGVTPEFGQ